MSDDADLDVPAIGPPDADAPGSSPSNPIYLDESPYRRVLADGTRKLFATAAASLKEQLDAEDSDEEVAIKPPDESLAAAAGAVAPSPGSPAAPSSPAAAAPAPDAAASRAQLQLEVREKSIADREAKLLEREKATEPQRERYLDKSATTIRDLVKEWTGAASDDEVKDEIADLITELSDSVLGLPVSSELRSRTESRRAVRQVKSYKADLTRREQALEERRAADEQKQRESAAANAVGAQLQTVAAKYPHLMVRDEPHAIVWDVIKTKASREPTWQPNWEEAAQLANDYYAKEHKTTHDKISRLFAPAATAAPAQAATHQGAPQSRGARTLTNAVAAPVTTSAPVESLDDEPYDRQAARRKSLGSLRAAIKERTT